MLKDGHSYDLMTESRRIWAREVSGGEFPLRKQSVLSSLTTWVTLPLKQQANTENDQSLGVQGRCRAGGGWQREQMACGQGAGALRLARSTLENEPGKKLPLVFVMAISAKHRNVQASHEFQLTKLVLIKVNLNSQGRWGSGAGKRE